MNKFVIALLVLPLLLEMEWRTPACGANQTEDNGSFVASADSVRVISIVPGPGMVLPNDRPATFTIRLSYSLTSADAAILSVSTAQLADDAGGCVESADWFLIDAVEVPIQRGTHEVSVALTWSGDTGAGTRGRVFGTGYLGFAPMFWSSTGGQRGERIREFDLPSTPCFRFGPAAAIGNTTPSGRLPPPKK